MGKVKWIHTEEAWPIVNPQYVPLLLSCFLTSNVTLMVLVIAFRLYTQVTKRRPRDSISSVFMFGFTCLVT